MAIKWGYTKKGKMQFQDFVETIEVDLTKPIEKLKNALDKDARWGINKAIKEGLTVKEADEKEVKEFYEIYREMCKRNEIKMHDLNEIILNNPPSYNRKIFVCKKGNKIISGVSITENKTNGIISLYVNASNPEYLKFQPNNLLYWSIIEHGKRINAKTFDLGGYDATAEKGSKTYEINRFKERWGGKIVKYPVYSNNPFYILGRKIIRNSSFLRRLFKKIKQKN
ncbi:MAG: peptidoglycan bridge formation glycyltransferase FemA/FemB family protein [archaeon]